MSISILTGLALLEFVLAPLAVPNVNRDLALMGFYAPPGTLVQDTRINSDGFTGHELSKIGDSANTTRILTLGGSTMFNRRMTERMIESWSDALPTTPRVVGAALRSHDTRASVIKYEYFFSKYRFDYVLIYHGINDLFANNVPPDNFKSDYSHMNPWNRRNLILDNSIQARLYFNSLHTQFRTALPVISNQANFAAERSFENNLRALVEAIRSNGGTPVLMTFAWFIPQNYSLERFQSGDLPYNNPTGYDICAVELWGDVAYVLEGLERHNAIVRRLAKELDVNLIDMHERLSDHPENFGDPVHFSETGTDRFIANLTDYFVQELGSSQ